MKPMTGPEPNAMNRVELQYGTSAEGLPSPEQFQRWVDAVTPNPEEEVELLIRIVDSVESARLNKQYRHQDGPTNVLSFPFDAPDHISVKLLGDLIICAPVVEHEAQEHGKGTLDHWAHMVVHGTLHLLGFDHDAEETAVRMEAQEIAILGTLGIDNPYEPADQ